ncbi:hypothetical protein P153DRAFT_303853 [Dothidotthia symphoricarpi CBS 119687]|uniref:Zinc finger PHD-type domain-containing protein n=1 Tax=Dothidotthia symphoricarpi CBS 119687 TaxID=1392245 RepID=A0A6A5ZWQ7_9PLEO|nr:uncharacterized protein P153DRAFT_303853 [Dothidotthia symphoricarpi CBS 119687]KAF2123465.1 hypothetical protein P153DRAFT_303853 [Dothidotthia symphoricarpi CBS 119687]
MDFSQIHTPPPTRDATFGGGHQNTSGDCSTPGTVIRRTNKPMPALEGLFSQTPYGLGNVHFAPDLLQFTGNGSLSAQHMPRSSSFWEQQHHSTQMDVDIPFGVDPFGPTPYKTEANVNWQKFHTPALAHTSSQALHYPSGVSTSGPASSFATTSAGDDRSSRINSYMSTSASVDPSMLFSFSDPNMTTSFGSMPQPTMSAVENRQPYETQMQDSMREKQLVKKTRSQHSRTSTTSSSGSNETSQPRLRRNGIDTSLSMKRSSSMDSRLSGSVTSHNIPRRLSPLKRDGSGSLKAIAELRRPRTRLVVDETGRARTETVHMEEESADTPKVTQKTYQQDLRHQYPGLWDGDETESEDDEPAPVISRQASFNMPQPEHRSSKYARVDSVGMERSNSYQMSRPSSRLSSGTSDRASFQNARHVRRSLVNTSRSLSMVNLPASVNNSRDRLDQQIPDAPGDALGALKKVVAGRQQQMKRASLNSLRAHNQRWAQATTDRANGHYDPYSNSFNGSPNTDELNTPSTDRGSISNENTRCICNGMDDGQPMVQCESCNKWLHMGCLRLNSSNLPPVYVCVFCTGHTPVARGGRVRGPMSFDSPLTHKMMFRR